MDDRLGNTKENEFFVEKCHKVDEEIPAMKMRYPIMLWPSFLCLGMLIMSPVFLNSIPPYECQQESDIYVSCYKCDYEIS